MHAERQKIQSVFIRICKDSGFSLSFDQVAALTSSILNISTLEVWVSMDIDTMKALADGTHKYHEVNR